MPAATPAATFDRQAQRLEALDRANRVRLDRARILRAIRVGARPWADAFDEPACAAMRVDDVLVAIPRVGRGRAATIRNSLTYPISPRLELRGLSAARRAELELAVRNLIERTAA